MNAALLLEHYARIADAPDAVARLRRFVLDLAVRGKLVEQDMGDEPVSELLRRISAEKARLVEAGELRKPRDLDNGDDLRKPWPVPPTWQWVRLDVVGAIVGGGTPPAGDTDNFLLAGDGIPWLTPADLGGYSDLYISRGSRDLSEKGARASSATLMPAGTVLFTSRAPIGYVAIAANAISTNQGFKSIVPYVLECSRFIACAMRAFAPQIDASAPGTTFKEVSGKILAGVPFPLPPLAEQHRIVAKVDELMGLCDQLDAARVEREAARDAFKFSTLCKLNTSGRATFADDARFALANLAPLTARAGQIKHLRQTIVNLAVRGKLVMQDPNDEPASEQLRRIAEAKSTPQIAKQAARQGKRPDRLPFRELIPPGWARSTLGELALSMRYGTSVKCEREAKGAAVLRIPNVSSGVIELNDLKFGPLSKKEQDDLALIAGDLLMIRSNGSLAIVGRSAVVTQAAAGMSFAGYLVRVRLLQSEMNSRYLRLALESTSTRHAIEMPVRSAVGLKNINLTEFSALSIPVPPIAEQHRIVAKVDALMALCDELETSIAMVEQTRTRLLDALLHEALQPASD